MDTMLANGDHAVDGRGIPISVTGTREIIQRALIRLGTKKGTFKYDLEFGSELFKLSRYSSGERDRVAMSFVKEALAPVRGFQVEAVSCTLREGDIMEINIDAVINGESYSLEVSERI